MVSLYVVVGQQRSKEDVDTGSAVGVPENRDNREKKQVASHDWSLYPTDFAMITVLSS